MFLRDLWYYALAGHELRRGCLLHRTLLGEPVLLGRTRAGEVFALRDICPHRAMPLSYGRLCDGQVECPYHGWRFDTAGTCVHIPSLVERQRRDISRIKVSSYPCHEVQGNIWVYFAERASARAPDPAQIPTVAGFETGRYQLARAMIFPCPMDHAVVGLMDPAHGPFVHQSWWWRSRSSIHEKAKEFAPSHLGFRMLPHTPSRNSRAYRVLGGTPQTQISFQLPGVRIEHVRTERHRLCGLTAVTPISETETRINHCIYWTMPWLSLLKPLLKPFATAFLGQDRNVVERQQEGLAYNPRLMLINDADVQAKWYYELKDEYTRATKEKRAFDNPVKACVLRWRS